MNSGQITIGNNKYTYQEEPNTIKVTAEYLGHRCEVVRLSKDLDLHGYLKAAEKIVNNGGHSIHYNNSVPLMSIICDFVKVVEVCTGKKFVSSHPETLALGAHRL